MIVIVGAGPAGMAAAVRARECGQNVTVLDDNPTAGGQIWRGGIGSDWIARFQKSGAKLITGARVVSGDSHARTLQLENGKQLSYDTLILATGARELFLPFPGWTLPNIMGVGGLQAMVKSGLPVKGKRIVVAGSGPLLLAVASYLRKKGAVVPLIAEQAPWGKLIKFTASLTPAKLLQAATLGTLSYEPDTWVKRAEGRNKLEKVHLQDGRTIRCDYLAVAYGFVPNNELATHLGPSDRILSAGECTGIGGVELSLIEGEIAGYTAAGREAQARKLFPARADAQRFADALNRTFAPRAELRTLAQAGTMICRCEDVTLQRLHGADSWREAKLHFRCGMGPCQGRICGPITQFLFNWPAESVRPPVFPTRIANFISQKETIAK
jgi:NADPH-dependent 2,4-dienoyl-CoA reductase/sulfur reductase-like enzyme